MPGRKKAAARPRAAICPETIDRARQSYVAAIARTRAFDPAPNALLDKATSLLTAHWGHASWASRATILTTVDWLLRVAINHPAPSPKGNAAQGPMRTGTSRA
jgi:hypothetical protein